MWRKLGIDSLATGTRIRHKESGIEGQVEHRLPPERGWSPGDDEYYVVTWDRMLPSFIESTTGEVADLPMLAGCRTDGFEALESSPMVPGVAA